MNEELKKVYDRLASIDASMSSRAEFALSLLYNTQSGIDQSVFINELTVLRKELRLPEPEKSQSTAVTMTDTFSEPVNQIRDDI